MFYGKREEALIRVPHWLHWVPQLPTISTTSLVIIEAADCQNPNKYQELLVVFSSAGALKRDLLSFSISYVAIFYDSVSRPSRHSNLSQKINEWLIHFALSTCMAAFSDFNFDIGMF